MAQASERQKTLRQRVYTAQATARVDRLSQRYLDTKDKAVIDIGRIITKVMKETEGEPTCYRFWIGRSNCQSGY
jgi:hypothetical protein